MIHNSHLSHHVLTYKAHETINSQHTAHTTDSRIIPKTLRRSSTITHLPRKGLHRL
jgi:hypothetical protein